MTTVVRQDRHGRDVRRDRFGLEYVKDEEGFTWYITPCCDAAASVNDGPMYCKACFFEVDPAYGGVPEPFEEDMTEDEKQRLAEWKAFERRIVARSLGITDTDNEE